ncbi:lipocalin family protein [Botryobacter ruber]|uniref:lipocalin family protein n=1 Tax=Botryobacter ruber TaxID=2171629 RepID=UPI001F0C6C52|nr:lipocalin family protein [Botryobacter ruber]
MKNRKRLFGQWHYLMALLLTLAMVSCGGEDKTGDQAMISGGNSKTWRADKELTASGDKDKLTDAEEQETMQFYADGRFALGGGGTLQTGTWSYDKAAKRLSLQFEGQGVSENFTVEELTENEMVLVANDGSRMELKAD